MAEQVYPGLPHIELPRALPAGEIVAVGVSEADYMAQYAETHHEWVRGVVIKMSPVRLVHDQFVQYLRVLLGAYLSQSGLAATVVGDPFVMRLPHSRREPDVQVVIGDNRANLRETFTDGPADICIEVVSPGSVSVDYGDKLAEYEAGGVREYWIIDPARRRTTFNRLNDEGFYEQVTLDRAANYVTRLLPGIALHVPTLWANPLPDMGAVWAAVTEMLTES